MTYCRAGTSVAPFTAKGFAVREYFPHRAVVIRKQYPDTFLLLEGRGVPRSELTSGNFYQLNLYSDHLAGFPDELFTDRGLNWHNQQLGQKGLIAAASLYVSDGVVTVTLLQSDLCQQLYRHAELKRICKTQLGKRFGYWYNIVFNAIFDFALERKFAAVYCPTAEWILRAIGKEVQPHLFQRIYDSPAKRYQCRRVERSLAEYWEVGIAENVDRIVRLSPAPANGSEGKPGKLICIFHDTEENVDTDISPLECRKNLTAMLAIEKSSGVRSTYNILGTLFGAKQNEIWASSRLHSLAFHSFNHSVSEPDQVRRCRAVNLQVRGYRPPRSLITPELTDYNLSYYNFEWLASGVRSLGLSNCALSRGIVKIPILTDDYPLVTGQLDYNEWENRIVQSARDADVLAFGLHDCYARTWIDSYRGLLDKLHTIGGFVTADELSDRVFWEQGNECSG